MKLMKLTVLSLAIITENSSNADYQVRFYLDPQHINLDDYNVDGNISLSKKPLTVASHPQYCGTINTPMR